ncbi:MAG: NAD(P)H-binding protein [Pseudomonadota bacterium]
MKSKVIVLGASGRFGRAAVRAFINEGWEVSAFVRRPPNEAFGDGVTVVTGDAFDSVSLAEACQSHAVIINAINPLYKNWERDVPVLTSNVIAAAKSTLATVMIPGNIYNYGNKLPSVLDENTEWLPSVRKGRLRIEMENTYRGAAEDGLRTIVLRGGDFMEGKATGNWFEDHIANKVHQDRITYPGPMDLRHAWAYLPDMAKAMAQLAEFRGKFQSFEEFNYEGYNLTGNELVIAIERVMGSKLKRRQFPWFIVHLASIFSKQIREVREMRYLWQRAHSMDGAKLKRALPDFEPTPLEDAMRECLASLPK